MEETTSVYCSRCFGYKRSIPWNGDVILWIPMCDWCLDRAAEREAKERKRLEQWAPLECAAPDCEIVFTPKRVGQRFHDERCRKRAHRWAKAAKLATSSNGHNPSSVVPLPVGKSTRGDSGHLR
jgi:hypothetical protein